MIDRKNRETHIIYRTFIFISLFSISSFSHASTYYCSPQVWILGTGSDITKPHVSTNPKDLGMVILDTENLKVVKEIKSVSSTRLLEQDLVKYNWLTYKSGGGIYMLGPVRNTPKLTWIQSANGYQLRQYNCLLREQE